MRLGKVLTEAVATFSCSDQDITVVVDRVEKGSPQNLWIALP
jgi:hypothetical protein